MNAPAPLDGSAPVDASGPSPAVPLPGGGLPIREWESALVDLDALPEDSRVDHAQKLLSDLEDALDAI